MLGPDEIRSFLENEGLRLSTHIVPRDAGAGSYYAFIEVITDPSGKQQPSNSRLKRIVDRLSKQEVSLEFILRNTTYDDIEGGARATLIHSFDSKIRSIFLTVDRNDADLWIVPKDQSIRDSMADIVAASENYFANTALQLKSVRLTVDENLPTRTAILSAIRLSAPASVEAITAELTARQFVVPPTPWVPRALDALRRNGLVVRRKDGLYALSFAALKGLGSERNRRSPDIMRFLDLARRGE